MNYAWTVLNDLHIGTLRSAGTTLPSALALRKFALDQLKDMLSRIETDLVIAGDMFDAYQIPFSDLLETYNLLVSWKKQTGKRCVLIPGNHDLSTDSAKMGSFQFMSQLLLRQGFEYLVGGGWVEEGSIYAISHVTNQDLFDMELAKVPKCKYLLVHANFDNDFAKEADHSLNVSAEQIANLPVDRVVFAHEHYYREQGKAFVMGNQFPMSVSDCLHKDIKCMHVLTPKEIKRVQTWDPSDYQEMDWQDLQMTSARFIRITGSAVGPQMRDAQEAVSRFRRGSDAFIVGNAVKAVSLDGSDLEVEGGSLESMRGFDLMKALEKFLTPRQMELLRAAKEKQNG